MPVKLYAFVVAYVHNGKGVLFHSTGHCGYMNGYTEFQVNAPEHLSQHIEVYFFQCNVEFLGLGSKVFKSSLLNRKNV